MRVSKEDLEKLQQNPSVTVRAEITQKVASGYREGQYSPAERELAQEIFRLLARDAEVTVRKALGEQLAHSMELPHDIALKLAQDVEAVSVPFLESSFALSEEDLIEITRSTEQLALLNALLDEQAAATVQAARAEARADAAASGTQRDPDPSRFIGLSDEPIASRARGTISGWEPGTEFTLENGQVWKVLKGRLRLDAPRESPEVQVVPGIAGRWFLQVDPDLPKARVYRID